MGGHVAITSPPHPPSPPLNAARLDWPHLQPALPKRLHYIPPHLHPLQRLRLHQRTGQPLLQQKVLLLFMEPLLHLVSSVVCSV